MEEAIAKIFSVVLLIVGLSRIVQAKRWANYLFDFIHSKSAPFIIGMWTLPVGLIIVVGHNKWAFEIPVIITLHGWGMVVKSSIYLLFPQAMAKVVPRTEESWRRTSIFAGGLMTILGALLVFDTYFRCIG